MVFPSSSSSSSSTASSRSLPILPSFLDIRRAESSLGLGWQKIQGLTFQGQWRNEQNRLEEGGGGRRKICITTTPRYTCYMQAPRIIFQSGVLTILLECSERSVNWRGSGGFTPAGVKGLSPQKVMVFRH